MILSLTMFVVETVIIVTFTSVMIDSEDLPDRFFPVLRKPASFSFVY